MSSSWVLHKLNDDILGEVFQFFTLPYLVHHVSLVNKHFHQLSTEKLRRLDLNPTVITREYKLRCSIKHLGKTLSKYSNLFVLNLDSLTQSVPHVLQMISEHVPLLRKLSLNKCKAIAVVSFDELKFRKLRELSLAGCNRVTTISSVDWRSSEKLLRKLRVLDMSQTSIDDQFCADVLMHFPKLTHFTAKQCQRISTPSFNNQHIQHLNFRGCDSLTAFSDNLCLLRERLTHLNLTKCKNFGVNSLQATLEHVGNSLQYLEIRSCPDLFVNPNFDDDLGWNPIFSALLPLSNLKWLYLSLNQVSDQLVESVLHQCPSLLTLELGKVQGLNKPRIVHDCLQNLYLDFTNITENTVIECPRLEKLNISNVKCTLGDAWIARAILQPVQSGTLKQVVVERCDNIRQEIEKWNKNSQAPVGTEMLSRNLGNLKIKM